jgi:hypothetical protein
MIELDGRSLSRAWLAVHLAASPTEERPTLYRAVHVEEFEDEGVRLIATDSFWMAICWVPVAADEWCPEPLLTRTPDRTVTISDDEFRVRDLMKHVAKLTKNEDDSPVTVVLDLATREYDARVPTLSPEMAPVRTLIELPGRERIMARTVEFTYPNWQALLTQFDGVPTGQPETVFSEWMLDRFSKVARAVGSGQMTLTWLDGHKGRWSIDQSVLEHAPRGIFMSSRTERDTELDEPDGTDGAGTPGLEFGTTDLADTGNVIAIATGAKPKTKRTTKGTKP